MYNMSTLAFGIAFYRVSVTENILIIAFTYAFSLW
uniref:Uncharacterized protein n=1 Tax=Anguilla anguilla TaxID=7936 RepID=A0A0E9RVX9_ANGAN